MSRGQKRKLLDAMRLDKKVSGGQVKFVLAKKLGQVQFGLPVETALVEDALRAVQA
jgi:3-dehydroquinate synthetase